MTSVETLYLCKSVQYKHAKQSIHNGTFSLHNKTKAGQVMEKEMTGKYYK